MVEQAGQVADVVGKTVVAVRRVGEPVSALVVGQDPIARRKQGDEIVPDARIGAERIDKGYRRAVGAAMQAVVQQYAIDPDKRHDLSPRGAIRGSSRPQVK